MKSWDWNKIFGFITVEWKTKLIALAGAVFLWYYVNSLSYMEEAVSMAIQYRNLPDQMVILESSDSSATMVIRGEKKVLQGFPIVQVIKPYVNLEHAQPGIKSYKIEVINSDPQPNMTIKLLKSTVSLKIDRLVTKTVPVKPLILGAPPEGYVMEEVAYAQKMVVIKGPSEIMGRITQMETLPVMVANLTNDVITPVYYNIPPFVSVEGDNVLNLEIRIHPKP